MQNLNAAPNIDRSDDFYADLLAIHDGLSPSESATINARLILILANQIGDRALLTQALDLAAAPAGAR